MKKALLTISLLLITTFAFADSVWIQIRFERPTPQGVYNDCLYFTPEEFNTMDQTQIGQLINERVDNWVSTVQDQSSKEPTKEEIQQKIESIEQQQDQLTQEKEELQNKLETAEIDNLEVNP